jgi:hypothetical protein
MTTDEAQAYAERLAARILREVALDRGNGCKAEDLSTSLVAGIEAIALAVAFGLEIPEEPEELWDADRATPVVMPADYWERRHEAIKRDDKKKRR